MVILITAITIILYVILIAFTIHNLSFITDNKVKIGFITIGLIVMFIISFIVFNISSSGINYENQEIFGKIRTMMLAVFAPVNGLIIMPYLANILNKLYSKEFTQGQFNKRIIILCIIFIILLVFECSYLKSTQQGILNIMNGKQ